MSRSRRRPYTYYVSYKSNKKDKTISNRKFRHHNKQAILTGAEVLYRLKECSNIFNFDSDGHAYYAGLSDDGEFVRKIKRK